MSLGGMRQVWEGGARVLLILCRNSCVRVDSGFDIVAALRLLRLKMKRSSDACRQVVETLVGNFDLPVIVQHSVFASRHRRLLRSSILFLLPSFAQYRRMHASPIMFLALVVH